MGQFSGDLVTRFLSKKLTRKPFELVESLSYIYHDDVLITVPAGYRTDFASIPKPLWGIMSPIGRGGKAAVIHDWLCDQKGRYDLTLAPLDYKESAKVFRQGLKDLGVGRLRRSLMYAGVVIRGPRF